MAVTFAETKAVRDKYQMGLCFGQMKEAMVIAEERFDGNILLGLLSVDANGLAVSIGRNLPPEERRKARQEWNDNWARTRASSDYFRDYYKDE